MSTITCMRTKNSIYMTICNLQMKVGCSDLTKFISIQHSSILLKTLYSVSPSEKVIDKTHVEETGSSRLLSLLKRINGELVKPSGGISSAPVTNERICLRLTEASSPRTSWLPVKK